MNNADKANASNKNNNLLDKLFDDDNNNDDKQPTWSNSEHTDVRPDNTKSL